MSISGGKTVWSHGRNTPVSIAATEEFLESNGLDVTSGQPVTWAQGLTWDTPTLSWADITHPEDRPWVGEHIRDAVRDGRRFSLQYRILTRGGDLRWVIERGIPVPDPVPTARAVLARITGAG